MKTVSYHKRNNKIPVQKFIKLNAGIISILGNVARSFHINKQMASLGIMIFFLIGTSIITKAQENLTQTIRGQIVDKASQSTLPGVNIIIENIEPQKGCISDANGWFTLENVPIGRHTITCSYMGYETVSLHNVLLLSGKQLMLNISMEERVEKLDEVVVKAYKRGETINKLTTNSARSFSVEETERYPGSFGDVARMASNFAGV
ncbi:MAG: carboxypeptidase-like regulatory domain-containing protein, partial [Bacteroidales bacterium]|nr:carboxypeptidase-like regulatory domain-containing protein [Bacteroidales bacterium]